MPAAIVDCPGIKHSYSSKVPSHHHKHYTTRSTNPQATHITDNEHKPQLNSKNVRLKSGSISSSLPLKKRTTASQSIPTSLPVQEEVPELETNVVELQVEEVPTTATQATVTVTTADPLYDDIQQLYPSEHCDFTLNVWKVLNYLTGPTPTRSYMEFPGMRVEEFEIIEHEVGETGRVPMKPRSSQLIAFCFE
ncbi:hypothetical protein BDR06DRAFT_1008342 [Suillus hirtellus]|nr:hypothetical protein BDR06DRAFT_1008342 [Suillus hirtellus]